MRERLYTEIALEALNMAIERQRPAPGLIHHSDRGIQYAAESYRLALARYGTAIVPARPYKPRDKAKGEVGVQMVGRWILARLRHRRFFSLADLNTAIRVLLDELNDRSMRGWGMSRRALFEALDQPALGQLPPFPYEYVEWKRCRVNFDYHLEIAKHFYSVPPQLIPQEVNARITATTVEIFHRGKRVASHRRSLRPHRPTTVAEHMPSSHRRYRDWTHEPCGRDFDYRWQLTSYLPTDL